MLGNEALRERLRRLVLERRGRSEAGADRGPDTVTDPAAAEAHSRFDEGGAGEEVGVEEFLPGGEWRGEHGVVYVHERLRSAMERRRSHWGRVGDPPAEEAGLVALAHVGLDRALFLDLETGGLSSSPVFLAGTMHWTGSDYVLRQYFARNYAEEAALIEAVSRAAAGFEFLVTFNGKSYDAPFLHQRAVRHGVRMQLPPHHLDLLHVARRRWRAELPDCRLQTLERHICRRHRSGDVPSEEVPALYHDFVRNGNPYRLVPVFHHNLLDVITMSELLHALCARRRPRWLELESLTPR